MKPARHIPFWLAAVIVTVAAALMPSVARAHVGHAHGVASTHSAISIDSIGQAGAEASVGRGLAVSVASARMSRATSIVSARLACACAACAACGHAPSSCCAVGIAPSPAPAFVPPPLGARAPVRDGPPLAGIVPEAHAEPPRPFA